MLSLLIVLIISSIDVTQSRLTPQLMHTYPHVSPEVQSCFQSVRNRSAYPGETFVTYVPVVAGLGTYYYSDRTSFITVSHHHLHR
jgi:hypothetical protein